MDEPSCGYRYSSARRGNNGPSPAIIAAAAIVVLATAIAVMYRKPAPVIVHTPPTPIPSPEPTTVPTVTATPTSVVELSSDWVEVSSPEDTPTPWPTIPPRVRREPTPTPRVSECVNYHWSTVQVFVPSAQVLTEIRANNGCNRDIGPTDLLFEISGWRNGGLVQSVRAMPFDRIRRRQRQNPLQIGLGSRQDRLLQGQRCLGLRQAGLKRPGIDLEQQRPLFDEFALFVVLLDQVAFHLGKDGGVDDTIH